MDTMETLPMDVGQVNDFCKEGLEARSTIYFSATHVDFEFSV